MIREEKTLRQFQVRTEYVVEEEEGFAFDHAKIITHSLLYLRRQAETDGRIVFDLMPEYFTLAELQDACEIILGKTLLTANFRRKMADYVVESDRLLEGAGTVRRSFIKGICSRFLWNSLRIFLSSSRGRRGSAAGKEGVL